jgi:hypothetical protein
MLGSPGLRAGKSPAFLVFRGLGPVRAVAGEEAGHEDLQQERGQGEVGPVRGKSRDRVCRGGQGVREADLVRGDARRVHGKADDRQMAW